LVEFYYTWIKDEEAVSDRKNNMSRGRDKMFRMLKHHFLGITKGSDGTFA
jgi:hypothetical protein